MQHKYTEDSAHKKWFTYFESKHIIFIFEEQDRKKYFFSTSHTYVCGDINLDFFVYLMLKGHN